jgi:C1q domain
MKCFKLIIFGLFITLILPQNLFSQGAPERINYQAVARDLSGNPLVSSPLPTVIFAVRQDSATGTVVYSETQTGINTNAFGLFTAQIGAGTPTFGTFPGITWGTSAYYLQVTIGTDVMPATQLLSVPYALYSKQSQNGPPGLDGNDNLADSITEPPGANCANGGYRIYMGVDDNGDGTLQPLERDINYYICNGLDGSANVNDTSATNELQTISISNDTIFLSNGGFVPLPAATADNDWIVAGNDMSSGITGNVGIGVLLPSKKLSVRSLLPGGDGIEINNASATGDPGLEFQTQGVPQFVLGVDQSDANKFKIGTTDVNVNPRLTIDNQGRVGIGTVNPPYQFSVISSDSVIASFVGTNPNFSVISVAGVNPNTTVGAAFLVGSDSALVALDPTQKTLFVSNTTVGGHVAIVGDSSTALYGQVVGVLADDKILNKADTILSLPSTTNNLIHINQGTYVTDSLYKLGNNSGNLNWVLANNGFGQAVWTDPATLPGGGGAWTSNGLETTLNTITDKVGIGTTTPSSVLNVISPDTIGIYTEGTNVFGTYNVTRSLVNGQAGELYTSGTDTVFHSLEPTNSAYYISYDNRISINTDTLNFGGATNPSIFTQNMGSFYNQDTIYTGGLYVYDNAGAVGSVLTDVGGGRAQWTTPSASGGGLWQSNAPDIYFNTGNVGIGMNTPLNALEVNTSALNTFARFTNSVSDTLANDGVYLGISSGDAYFNNAENGNMLFYTNNSEKVRIDNLGNVGIGTATPLARLHVAGDGQTTVRVQASNNNINDGANLTLLRSRGPIIAPANVTTGDRLGTVEFLGYNLLSANYDEVVSIRGFADEPYNGGSTASHLEFHVNPMGQSTMIEAMRINGNGFIGIGEPSPSSTVDVIGNIEFTSDLRPNNLPGAVGQVLTSQGAGVAPTWLTPGAVVSPWTRNGGTGDVYPTTLTDFVGIGTNAPTEMLAIGSQGTATGIPGPGFQEPSNRIALTGSYWNGGSAVARDFTLHNEASTTVGNAGRLAIGWSGTGSELMSISSTAMVGIGTTNSSGRLNLETFGGYTIYFTNTYGATIYHPNNGIAIDAALGVALVARSTDLSFSTGAIPTTKMIIKNTGDVGIGTINPSANLHIESNSTPVLLVKEATPTSGSSIIMESLRQYHLLSNELGDFKIQDLTAGGIQRFVITPTGNVGIGTLTPNANFDVSGITETDSLRVLAGAGTAGEVLTSDALGNATWQTPASGALWQSNVPDVYFNSGNVGIGTSSPSSLLHIQDVSITPNSMLEIEDTGFNPLFTVLDDGNVGIGVTPLFPLHVNTSTQNRAAMFNSTTNSTGFTYGMRSGAANSTAGGSSVGVYGGATGVETNYGIYGEATGGSTNWAGYFGNGNVYIQNTLVIPTNAGAGRVLTSDAAGIASWKEKRVAFSAFMSNPLALATTGFFGNAVNIVPFDMVVFDDGVDYDPSIGANEFTAPVPGVYSIEVGLLFDYSSAGPDEEIQLGIMINGAPTPVKVNTFMLTSGTKHTATIATTIRLNVGDKVRIEALELGASSIQIMSGENNWFSAHLVYAD